MVKRLSICLAIFGLLASIGPTLASATKATLPAGTLMPVGTVFMGTGSDVTFQSNLLGAITCSTLNLNFGLTKNDGTTVEAEGAATLTPTQSGCKNGTKAVIVTQFTPVNITSTTSGSLTFSFSATVDIASLSCSMTGTKVPGTFTPGTNVIKFSSAGSVSATPAACGTSKLSGEFTLEKTLTSTAVNLD
jgi:hypothetical protein